MNRLPFVPPEYPYERLGALRAEAANVPGGAVDLSIGTPCDPPPASVVEALARAQGHNGYPASRGSDEYLAACRLWLARRFGIDARGMAVAACIGTKELVASLPHLMRLREPDRDVVLYPELSYPTYEMGAILAGCTAVPVPVDESWRLDLGAIIEEDAARACVLWVNSPGNPAGQLDDLERCALWGREKGVLVASDECYAELTWSQLARTVLENGVRGVLALHSLSKRSNLAGLRCGFYAGDPEVVEYLAMARMHAGMMMPSAAQAAGAVAWADDAHAAMQREVYRHRLTYLVTIFRGAGADASMPEGGLYLWVPTPAEHADGWAFAGWLAREAGAVVSPGDLYGSSGKGYVRVAAVQSDERIELIAGRLGV